MHPARTGLKAYAAKQIRYLTIAKLVRIMGVCDSEWSARRQKANRGAASPRMEEGQEWWDDNGSRSLYAKVKRAYRDRMKQHHANHERAVFYNLIMERVTYLFRLHGVEIE